MSGHDEFQVQRRANGLTWLVQINRSGNAGDGRASQDVGVKLRVLPNGGVERALLSYSTYKSRPARGTPGFPMSGVRFTFVRNGCISITGETTFITDGSLGKLLRFGIVLRMSPISGDRWALARDVQVVAVLRVPRRKHLEYRHGYRSQF